MFEMDAGKEFLHSLCENPIVRSDLYPTKEKAIESARTWADNAGYVVEETKE